MLFEKDDSKPKSRWTFGFDFGFSIMVFGYTFDFLFDIFDWQLKSYEAYPVCISLWVGPFYVGLTDATIKQISASSWDAEVSSIEATAYSKAVQGFLKEIDELNQRETQLEVKYTQALNEIEKLRKPTTKIPVKRSHKKKVTPKKKR
jgi:hypothetical protein